MRIAEISCTPDHRRSSSDSDHSTILSLMESSIRSLERHLPAQPLPTSFYSELPQAVAQLNKLAPFANSIRLATWKLSYRLCNTCVGLSNASSANISEEHAKFRQAAAELIFLTADVVGIPSPEFKAALFFYKTGLIWYELRQLDLANNFYEKAADPVTLWNRSETVLFGITRSCNALATHYLTFRKSLLSNVNGALKLMNDALELCEKGLTVVRRTHETLNLTEFRFIAAAHLQINDFESVLKCVNVSREVGSGGDHHPSLSLLAVKAWLGLGNFEKTEKELRGMVMNKGVWVSVVESYFQATGEAGAETVKGAFIGLLEHSQDEGMQGGARVVTELISGQRVVALEGASERTAIHALLFNCETENFRSKDYGLGAEVFEKFILFVAHGAKNRLLKAKGYRVLCLCYLGLLQLDRAIEYANEAEKLEPNIASACLKFKIFLQKNDQDRAISQMQAMLSCLDFTDDFISQADHEAVSSRALPVVTAFMEPCLSFVGQKGGETGTSKETRGSSLPGEVIEYIMVRSRFTHPKSRQVSKYFNEKLISEEHFKERERDGHQEASIYFCIYTYPDEYIWYTELRDGQGWECRRLPRMPEQQGFSSVVGVGSSIYVMGGTDTRGIAVNSLFIFDGIRNRWSIGSPMNVCRYLAPCGVWNDTIYIFCSGIFSNGTVLDLSYYAEKYIIQSGSWEEVTRPSFFPIPLPSMDGQFFVKDSIIYVVADHEIVALDMRTEEWHFYPSPRVFDALLRWHPNVEIGDRIYSISYGGIRVITDVMVRSKMMRNMDHMPEHWECRGGCCMANLDGRIGMLWIRRLPTGDFCVTCTEIRIGADEAGVRTGTLVRRQNHDNVAIHSYSKVEACIALKF